MSKRFTKITITIFLFLSLAIQPAPASAGTLVNQPGLSPTELVTQAQREGFATWEDWLKNKVSVATVLTPWFGAYDMVADDGLLYVGWGRGRPGENNYCRSAIGVFDGNDFTFLFEIDEEGIRDLSIHEHTLWVGGADPCDGDGQQGGNAYKYTPPGPYVKIRGDGLGGYLIPNVYHTFGQWVDPSNGDVYITTGSHAGDFSTNYGEMFRTTDEGASWSRILDVRTIYPASNRAFNIVGYNDKLYFTSISPQSPLHTPGDPVNFHHFFVSEDNGSSWELIEEIDTDNQVMPVVVDGKLVVLEFQYDNIYTIDASDNIENYSFPGFIIAGYFDPTYPVAPGRNYNLAHSLTTVGTYLYLITDSGQVIRSKDFETWEIVSDTTQEYLSIEYWEDQNKIVLSDRGAAASLWFLDLDEFASISGVIWKDENRNGIRDAGDTLVEGAEITLLSSNQQEITSKITAADGAYAFTDIIPGDYYAKIEVAGSVGFAEEGEVDPETGFIALNLTAGASVTDIDAGVLGGVEPPQTESLPDTGANLIAYELFGVGLMLLLIGRYRLRSNRFVAFHRAK